VLVTHDAELASLADARLVLRDGHVIESDLPIHEYQPEPLVGRASRS
jgi:ABC-type lipoprotein export system ATPase subunit